MSLFAIADLHLSLGEDKPMDIFTGWENYTVRLENNWRKIVKDSDTVVIGGDISWAMKLEETYEDFKFINNLPGKKIFIKGNHDYWWGTKNKIDKFLADNSFDTISVLFNNSYVCDDYSICGTRGWFLENDTPEDVKVLNREIGRLITSIESALKSEKTPVVFLHYPPVFGGVECKEIVDILLKYGIKKCFYGHIHGKKGINNAYEGNYKGIDLKLISCDRLSFTPLLIR